MITDKTELQKQRKPEKQTDKQFNVSDIGYTNKPIYPRQISGGIVPLGNKVTATAAANDGYVEVSIGGKKVKLMTRA